MTMFVLTHEAFHSYAKQLAVQIPVIEMVDLYGQHSDLLVVIRWARGVIPY